MSILDAMAAGIAERGHVAWESLTEGEKIAARETVRAALKAAGAMGWKLVPVEATVGMQGKGSGTLGERGVPISYNAAKHCYRAMIAAEPSIEDGK